MESFFLIMYRCLVCVMCQWYVSFIGHFLLVNEHVTLFLQGS